jgi:phospholipid-binding lipoprotein MlaA
VKKLHLAMIAALSTSLLAGCVPVNPATKIPQDPYESYNRGMFQFDTDFNNTFLQPVVTVYNSAPNSARSGVRNFFDNVRTINDIGNDLLQANWHYARLDTSRFFINTTLGFFGFMDPASKMGIQPHQQSFGLTLAKWGIVNSPYLVLPILGPSTVTGTIGLVPDHLMNPISYVSPADTQYGLVGLNGVQTASDSLPKERFITSMALDPYVAIRNAYMQNREYVLQQIQSDGVAVNQAPTPPVQPSMPVPVNGKPDSPVKQKVAAPGRL